MKLKNERITKLETEVDRFKRVIQTNNQAKSQLKLEDHINKLLSERQTFFNYKFDMEQTIKEKEDLLEQKDLQISVMKGQIKILADEIDEMKKSHNRVGLVPKNVVRKIRGGGGKSMSKSGADTDEIAFLFWVNVALLVGSFLIKFF